MAESSNLLDDSPEASAWVDHIEATHPERHIFGKIRCGVIWTSSPGIDGEPLVPVDPSVLAGWINADGLPLFNGHDSGSPVGQVIAAKIFTSTHGVRFVAAVFGFYSEERRVGFSDLGLDSMQAVQPPQSLPQLAADVWMAFETDPREVDAEWQEDALINAPLPVKRKELSHNAAEPLTELIRIGLPYVVLVWNPFITTVATEAGKDAYASTREWLRKLWKKLAARRSPIVQISSYQDGCEVSFLFRGNDVAVNYAAHDALSTAAMQAAQLIGQMRKRQIAPRTMTYEFDSQSRKWYPSYTVLQNGQLVSDRNLLIALEQLPSQLSLGIGRHD
ncbi:hypothetical protein [Peristeroidobacter agariperforans]|uniref:hypothetical protein n=1 Tax=Peristeroidobacter agariperforans TaxID=268404 RepID=UPI00101D3637|nr:hypothetical protein [Peristeroidobacter agariperforans]